eukprot:g32097.t1
MTSQTQIPPEPSGHPRRSIISMLGSLRTRRKARALCKLIFETLSGCTTRFPVPSCVGRPSSWGFARGAAPSGFAALHAQDGASSSQVVSESAPGLGPARPVPPQAVEGGGSGGLHGGSDPPRPLARYPGHQFARFVPLGAAGSGAPSSFRPPGHGGALLPFPLPPSPPIAGPHALLGGASRGAAPHFQGSHVPPLGAQQLLAAHLAAAPLGFSPAAAAAAAVAQSDALPLAGWQQFCMSPSLSGEDRARVRSLPPRAGITVMSWRPADAPLAVFAEFSLPSASAEAARVPARLFRRAGSRSFEDDWSFLLDAFGGWSDVVQIVFGLSDEIRQAVSSFSLALRQWHAARWPAAAVAEYIEVIRREAAAHMVVPDLRRADAPIFEEAHRVLLDKVSAVMASAALARELARSSASRRPRRGEAARDGLEAPAAVVEGAVR